MRAKQNQQRAIFFQVRVVRGRRVQRLGLGVEGAGGDTWDREKGWDAVGSTKEKTYEIRAPKG